MSQVKLEHVEIVGDLTSQLESTKSSLALAVISSKEAENEITTLQATRQLLETELRDRKMADAEERNGVTRIESEKNATIQKLAHQVESLQNRINSFDQTFSDKTSQIKASAASKAFALRERSPPPRPVPRRCPLSPKLASKR